ncbi:hypothetical protein EZV62_013585 [Acer yangbiense]|uniref:F-box/LRR-repeat protein 15/At3g58940/PEG3-like LRR domain-containing protein n=1 Tax=Acer yangbiense TaxID=1000413 RepID=A0A5C7I1C5_9ROSI|nr:hypothetical protein EZV62_013585 [Acer yangbiense]
MLTIILKLGIGSQLVCFPSLKTLHIEAVDSNSNLMQKFFRSCPVLEEFTIRVDIELNENVMTFDITVPTLKTLNIYLLPDCNVNDHVSIHKFVVRAHNLEQLYIDDDCLACFVMDETPFISVASLDGCFSLLSRHEPSKNEANRAMVLLRAIKNTKFLSLSEGVMGVLILAFDGNLPTFPNLIGLEAGVDAYFGWKLLPHFLNNSPNLEVLILKKEYVEDLPLDRFFYFESENVPSCLSLHVKEIKMIHMMGDLDELEKKEELSPIFPPLLLQDHKVQNLEIDAYYDTEVENWLPIRLPQSILTCKTLVKLKLCSLSCDFVFDIPDSVVCFPSLKTLHIEAVESNSNLMQKFFCSCPVLEELTICVDIELNENVMTFDITVPTLKTLNIFLLPDCNVNDHVSIHKFVVRAHNLEQLYIDYDTLACIVMDETPFISDASLDGCLRLLSRYTPSKTEANRAVVLLRAIKNTKFLSLSEGIMGVLILAFDGNLPTFLNLIRLEAGIDAYFGWKLLPHFLNNSPNLEVLILKKKIKMIHMMGDHDEMEVISIKFLGKNSNVCEHRMTRAFQDSMKITEVYLFSSLVFVAAFCFRYVFWVVSYSSGMAFNQEVKG